MSERRLSERRDEEEAERRKIPRFTDSELNQTLNQTKTWLYVMYATSIVVAIFETGIALSKGLENLTEGIFFGTVFIILSILIWKSIYTVKLYLSNHSIGNLQRIHEQLRALFAYLSVLGIVFYLTSLFYRL